MNSGNVDNWDDLPFLKRYGVGNQMAWRSYTEKYLYDEVGNFRQTRHIANGGSWTRDYGYDDAINNRLKYTKIGDVQYNYAHHPQHGFITEMPHLQVMEWNFKEEVCAVAKQRRTDGGVPETTYYVYDSSGQRIRKITEISTDPGNEPSKKNEHIYLGDYEVYREFKGIYKDLKRETLHIMDDKQRIAMIETRNEEVNDGTAQRLVRYQFSNHLGTACLETDDSENPKIISYEEFHPYGSTAYQAMNTEVKAANKRYRYTDKERDEESGFNYHGARYYAPWIGRWVSCDPAGLVDGVNLFTYTNNQPTQLVDPSGNSSTGQYTRPDVNSTKVITLLQPIFKDVLPEGLTSENYPIYRDAFYNRLREVLTSPKKHELQNFFKVVTINSKGGPRTAIRWIRGPFKGEFLRIHHNLSQSAIRQLPKGFKIYAADPRNLVPLGDKFHNKFAPLTGGSNKWRAGSATLGCLSKLAFGAGIALAGLAAAGEIGTVLGYGDTIDDARSFVNQLEAQAQEELAAGMGDPYEPVMPFSILENEEPREHFNFFVNKVYRSEKEGYRNYLYVRSSDPNEPQYKRVGQLKPDPTVWGEERGNILALSISEKVHIKVLWSEQRRAWISIGPRWYKR
jgi:RHS repeat-associated protein